VAFLPDCTTARRKPTHILFFLAICIEGHCIAWCSSFPSPIPSSSSRVNRTPSPTATSSGAARTIASTVLPSWIRHCCHHALESIISGKMMVLYLSFAFMMFHFILCSILVDKTTGTQDVHRSDAKQEAREWVLTPQRVTSQSVLRRSPYSHRQCYFH